MSNPGEPRRSQSDRGYYGAGWSRPGPAAPGWGGAPENGAPRPAARPRPARSDPRRAFAPGASVPRTAGALIAVVAVVLVEFVSGLVGLLGASLVVSPFSSFGGGDSLISGFVQGVFAAPFPFYVGAFLALAFLTPIDRRSPLPSVLLRAVLAGAAGTVALALVGVVTGSVAAVHAGGGHLVIGVLTSPLQNGLPFTVMLLATATAAWLWLGRPRAGAGPLRAPGTPGRVRPADAVPPATVQAPVQQPPAPSGAQQPVQPPYGAGQPTAPWDGPAPR